MRVEIVTKEDLQVLRMQLLSDIMAIIVAYSKRGPGAAGEAYKTKDVRKILGCSIKKLASLRAAQKVRWEKIGGAVYYNREDVRRLVDEGF